MVARASRLSHSRASRARQAGRSRHHPSSTAEKMTSIPIFGASPGARLVGGNAKAPGHVPAGRRAEAPTTFGRSGLARSWTGGPQREGVSGVGPSNVGGASARRPGGPSMETSGLRLVYLCPEARLQKTTGAEIRSDSAPGSSLHPRFSRRHQLRDVRPRAPAIAAQQTQMK